MNTKFHLYRELKRGDVLRLERYCQGKCGTKIEVIWAADWNDVQVEYRIDAVRPDIVLLRNGKEICALEVFAMHALDTAKKEYLAQKELPWLEVKATTDFYDGEHAWRIEKPLPFHTINPEQELLCNDCLAKKKKTRIESVQPKEMTAVMPDDYLTDRGGDVLNQHGVCQFCGVDTTDWWSFDGKTNTCKCRDCAKRGIY